MYHLISSSTNLYWPSTSQYRHILTQYHQVPLKIHHLMSHAQYTWSSSSFDFVFVFVFVLFFVVQCHSSSGGGRRACFGRLRPCQSILQPSCRCKQVSFLFKSFKIFLDWGLHNFWVAKYFQIWNSLILMCKSTSKDITQAQTSRSLATVRLVFTRTIGYYFLRTYFPLIIIVFWWGKARRGICQCQF